jgi:hypothetical protein
MQNPVITIKMNVDCIYIELRELHTYILVCATVQVRFSFGIYLAQGPW